MNLAIDPGFDVTGWAVFRSGNLNLRPATLNDALGLLVDSGQVETSTADADAARLASLGIRIRQLCIEWDITTAYVELPAFEGSYTGGKERRAGVNKLYMALGVILSRIPGEVIGLPAIRAPKETRHQLLEHAARVNGMELPAGPRGGAREDTWDAIWLGCQGLMERPPSQECDPGSVSHRHS